MVGRVRFGGFHVCGKGGQVYLAPRSNGGVVIIDKGGNFNGAAFLVTLI